MRQTLKDSLYIIKTDEKIPCREREFKELPTRIPPDHPTAPATEALDSIVNSGCLVGLYWSGWSTSVVIAIVPCTENLDKDARRTWAMLRTAETEAKVKAGLIDPNVLVGWDSKIPMLTVTAWTSVFPPLQNTAGQRNVGG